MSPPPAEPNKEPLPGHPTEEDFEQMQRDEESGVSFSLEEAISLAGRDQ